MKIIPFVIFILLIAGCSDSKYVYWCGDHACVNKKEKKDYFEKEMIVELKNIDKKNNTEKIKKNIIKRQKEKNLKEKKVLKKQKKNKKLARMKKKNFTKSNKSDKKEINKNEVAAINTSNSSEDFNDIKRNILEKNMNRDFPDINDISK